MIVNKIRWKSSGDAGDKELVTLNQRMSDFYSKMESRTSYQSMLDSTHKIGAPVNMYSQAVASFTAGRNYRSVLEIGCGNGQFFELLVNEGYRGSYTGVEMATAIIDNNARRFPDAKWYSRSVYDLDGIENTFDCCVSLFVLEHLVFPEKALRKMLSKVRPGGDLILVFPDFRESTIFPSQRIGIRHGKLSTKQKLSKLHLFDAVCGYLEGRIVARELKSVNRKYGDFVVNLEPYCLVEKELFPDSDAVFLSNKEEIEKWAVENSIGVSYPRGTSNEFSINAFMVLSKPLI